MKVLITGASGFVGKEIVKDLLQSGDEVVVLTRNIAKAAVVLGKRCQYVQWADASALPPVEAFDKVDAVINLMGEGIADKPWTEEQKNKIYHSRIDGTAKLIEAMKGLTHKPKIFVSTSAIGIYGNRGAEDLNESSSWGKGFLAKVCQDWETEALKAKELGLRVAIIRVGVVIGKGGALSKMLLPFKMGVGGKLGSGQQYMSWIHVEDVARLFVEAAKNNSYSGIYNGTAPKPVTNAEFTKALGKRLCRPTIFPVPAFVVKKAFGEMGEMLLTGQKVLPVRAKDQKFRFLYPTIEIALNETKL
ncbi:MAG: TIGR01777 family oxidoreductase [Bacteriovoracaceae bacterium]